ncbi:hypothetical protein R1flu_005322 [Riccia fluitans]|uniref:B box-type domain-containing protein n=1 Tax=Riccia fluitans TaxID=41844 RepID=A0ABD1YSU4_9MARC
MEKRCELCGDRATVYCPADDANVCWSCDAKVHSANFLVARHSRSVLCSKCCQPTDCRTSGSHPSPLSRLCAGCNPLTTVTRLAVEDCNGDSEEKEYSETLSYPSAATVAEDSGCTCASEESHTNGHTTGGQDRRKQVVESMGRAAKGLRGSHTGVSRQTVVQERGKKVQGRRIKKRSSSPTGLRIQSLQLDASRSHRAEGERLEESGEGSNSVSPPKQPCSSPFCFQLLEREPDESSCVSFVEGEGYEL